MGNSFAASTLALIGGASLGAVAMYLLDPDQGSNRRKDIHSSASDAVSGTVDAAHSTWQNATAAGRSAVAGATDYAHNLAEQVHDRASSAVDHAVNHAADLHEQAVSSAHSLVGSVLDSIKSYGKQAVGTAKGYVDHAKSSARGYADDKRQQAIDTHEDLRKRGLQYVNRGRDRAAAAISGKQSHPYAIATGVTAGTVGVLAIGVGLMYFLDPERGEARRSKIQKEVVEATRRAGYTARQFGRNLGGKLKHENPVHQEWESQFNGPSEYRQTASV